MRIHFKQSRLARLNEAISLAVELNAYNSVEKCDKKLYVNSKFRRAVLD